MLPGNGQMFNRDRLRREVLAFRDKMPRQVLEEKSRQINARLWQIDEFMNCRTVMLYASFRSEVRTAAAIARCLEAGIRVALPLSVPGKRQLLPYLVEDPDRDLRAGYCNIPEPDPARTRLVSPSQIEAVVVPGAVFDLRGGRLGYGGGFYDRFLAMDAPGAWRIGLAFELQVAPGHLPLAPHDQIMHCLVTEDRAIYFDACD
jgi:5-formyltetrahydrofolate cyclo-ligase